MSSRKLGPFPGLSDLSDIDVNTADELDILERCDLVNSVLAEANCNCNGHAKGGNEGQRDEYWGGDLSEIVAQCTAYETAAPTADDPTAKATVRILIETLRVVVDDNMEIMAWQYAHEIL